MRNALFHFVVLSCLARIHTDCSAQAKRVKTPDWQSIDVSDIFFNNAFRDALQGERPPQLAGKRPPALVDTGNDTSSRAPSSNRFRWSSVISSATIEDEVKRLSRQLDASLTQPATFAGRGYRQARQQFSMLAALFAMVHEYDGDIRWKSSAAAARDRFAYVASIAQVGTAQVYNIARKSKSELADLIRGDRLVADLVERRSWTELLDRGPLMQRLEQAHQGIMEPALASAAVMKSQAVPLLHEAEIAAALAQLLSHEGMDEWDDQQYVEFCEQLKRGATAVIQSVKQNDYEAAVNASGVISKSCSHCHESYRG